VSDIIFEPFRIKVVEPIEISTTEQRRSWLTEAGYNVFNVPAQRVMIDLLTDSGTSAMSNHQWSALQSGDESYAGSKSFYELEACAQDLFCKKFIIPVHQGRAGEHLVFSALVKEGDVVPSNGHFDTTAANIEDNKARALNLPSPEAKDLHNFHPFKGNIDLVRLEDLLKEDSKRIPFVMLSVTNNTGGGQPVSLENVTKTKELCVAYGKRLIVDACRFAENSAFIQKRESHYSSYRAKEIAQNIFRLADCITFSGKKDAFSNIGGLVCVDDESLAETLKNRLIITEGFATYGGLAGRDLAAMAQ
jgi:tryptophanase